MKYVYNIIVSLFLILLPTKGLAQSALPFSELKTYVNSGRDATDVLNKALQKCAELNKKQLILPKGRYDFNLNNASKMGIKYVNLHHFTFDAQGSEFVFHGEGMAVVINLCDDLTLKNFSIDWEHPFTYQVKTVRSTKDYLDIMINSSHPSYTIENGKLFFISENWKKPAASWNINLYDAKNHEIAYKTHDNPLGNIFEQFSVSLNDSTVRLYGKTPLEPEIGSIAVIHTDVSHYDAITIEISKDILLQNIPIYYSPGRGVLAQHVENITLDNTAACTNSRKQRVFSTTFDNAHFNNCKGLIKIQNCKPTGMGDDAINIHGRYYKIIRKHNDSQVEVVVPDASISKDEELWVLPRRNHQRIDTLTVIESKETAKAPNYRTFILTFNKKLPRFIKEGDCLESKTWTPSVIIRNCTFGKKNRARGILVTTPQKVSIRDNYFRTAGAAILIEGDMGMWMESGGCRNITIENNIFEDCLTSGSENGTSGEWGEAIITVTPQETVSFNRNNPYHRGIKIRNNIFKTFDIPILHARYADIEFSNNKLTKTDSYAPYAYQQSVLFLESCPIINEYGNSWNDFPVKAKRISIK